MARTNYWRFFLLMFIGLSILALGFNYLETLLIAFGAIFVLAVMLNSRNSIPTRALGLSIAGLVVGGAVGSGISQISTTVTGSFAGVIGGATIGALLGFLAVSSILGTFGLQITQNIVFSILYSVGALVGGVIGVIYLRNIMMKMYGSLGSGLVSLGSLGLVLGFFIGLKLSKDAEE